jgi:hypothetical protein
MLARWKCSRALTGCFNSTERPSNAGLLAQGSKCWGPGARLTVLDVPSSGEYLAYSCPHRASRSEATEQLKIHLWIGKTANPRCRTSDAVATCWLRHAWSGASERALCNANKCRREERVPTRQILA